MSKKTRLAMLFFALVLLGSLAIQYIDNKNDTKSFDAIRQKFLESSMGKAAVYENFYSSAPELVKSIAEIHLPDGRVASGFLLNNSTLVTAGHVAAATNGKPAVARFPFLEGMTVALEHPVYNTGLPKNVLALYLLTAADSAKIDRWHIKYPSTAEAIDLQQLSAGQIVFIVSPNPARQAMMGSPLQATILEYEDFSRSYWSRVLFPPEDEGAKETFGELYASFGVLGLFPGDSGSPVFATDTEGKLVLIGIANRVNSAVSIGVLKTSF